MNEERLVSALRDGTKSWEVTIFCALALSMQSALCARAGEIAGTAEYRGMEVLCWKDVTLKLGDEPSKYNPLPRGFTSPKFEAVFLLRCRKGKRLSATH